MPKEDETEAHAASLAAQFTSKGAAIATTAPDEASPRQAPDSATDPTDEKESQ